MAKEKIIMEETNSADFTIDTGEVEAEAKAANNINLQPVEVKKQKVHYAESVEPVTVNDYNCLTNKTVTVKHLPQNGMINDPKHVLYGGLAERSVVTFTVPRLRSGIFVNVLTDKEKDCLERLMGLEKGAMNVYNKVDNFWSNATEGGISQVRLGKFDTILHLNDPVEYIQYKILLANKDTIAPDLHTWQNNPKATYQYVLIAEDAVSEAITSKTNQKQQSWMALGKIDSDVDTLRTVVETITSKPLAHNTSIEFLKNKAAELIDADAKLFLKVAQDPLLPMRVFVQKCVEEGFISKKGDWYYLRSDNTPLCEPGEDPTLLNATRFLSSTKRQEMKMFLEAKLKQ